VDPTFNAAHALKCDLAGEVLRSSGKLRLRVTGWSMLPSVWPGDTLLIERVGREEVSEGDIVLFGRDRRLFAHRVVTKVDAPGNSRIITQGDGMPRPDAPLADSELLGRVTFIVRNGKLIEPRPKLGLPGRAVAGMVRRSVSAARVLVGVRGRIQNPEVQVAPWQR
jgi:signal peptidase I